MTRVLRYFHQDPTKTVSLPSTSTTTTIVNLDSKQDKIKGKSLSTNDFTDIYKQKLKDIEDKAEVNVQADWNTTDTEDDSYIKNKPSSLPASDVYDWAKQETKPSYNLDEILDGSQRKLSDYIPVSLKGVYGGVATLGANDGKVPESQLPSYVDDVLEFSDSSYFPQTGESGKIYVDIQTNLTYRWTGTQYTEISPSIALGETSSTAYAGDKGAALKTAFENHAADTTIHITAAERAAWNAKQDAISDLETIRSNASTAYGWGDHSLAGYLTSVDIADMATKTWVGLQGYTTNTGTVTSVAMTVPTGLSVSGSPITTNGTLAITFASGYSIPTTTKLSNWDTAYGWGDHSLAGYQMAISDLATIRSRADEGHTAYGWGDHSQQGYVKSSGVTSVAMTVPTGLSISGSPITSTGTLALSFANGYSIPTDAKQSNWDTAYSWGNHANEGYLKSITSQMVTNALGYTPPTQDTNTWRPITDTYTGSDTGTSVSQKGTNDLYNALVNGYASSAGNADTLDSYHASSFLLLSGGDMVGTITRNAGGGWINGRDNAIIKTTRTSGEGWDWHPAVAIKTSDGCWTFGSVGGETLMLSYDTDSDYNYGNNNSHIINFPAAGSDGTLALTSQIPTYTSLLTNDSGFLTSHQSLSGYLPLTGGTMTGNIIFSGDNKIEWSRNTDGAGIRFKNTDNADSNSYMSFYTLDDYNEYFRFSHSGYNGDDQEWFTIKPDGARVLGNIVWHAGNDGSGSGLDADTLDGLHETAFFRVRNEVNSNSDANNINQLGGFLNATGNGTGNSNYPEVYSDFFDFPIYYHTQFSCRSNFYWRTLNGNPNGTNWRTLIDSYNYKSWVIPNNGTWMPSSMTSLGAIFNYGVRGHNSDGSINDAYMGWASTSNDMHVYTDGQFWQREGAYYCLDNGNTYVNNGTGVINGTIITQVSNADTVDNLHASSFAQKNSPNDMIHSGNEFTWASPQFSGDLWMNYRTASTGLDGNITRYLFGDGKGGCLGIIGKDTFYGNITGSADTVDGYHASNLVFEYNSGLTGNDKIYDVPAYSVFSGYAISDAPANTGWVTGIALAQNKNNEHYQSYLITDGGTWWCTADYENGSMKNWKTIWTSGNDGSGSGLDADTVDGYHENSFLRFRGGTSTNGEGSLWSQIGIKEYYNVLPDGLSGVYSYGSVISIPGPNTRFDIYASHIGSDLSSDYNSSGIYVRTGWNDDRKRWRRLAYADEIAATSGIRDYTQGTLIRTHINYNVTNGDAFYMEITGECYACGFVKTLVRGYIYNDIIINYGVENLGTLQITELYAMNLDGILCFWFPRLGYWHSFDVKVYKSSTGNYYYNYVAGVLDSAKPTGTKEVLLTNDTYNIAFTTSNVASATQLQTTRYFWGHAFNGTADVTGTINLADSIEFTGVPGNAGHGGYIDFHYNGSSADYTSRIIEDLQGRISVNNSKFYNNAIVTERVLTGLFGPTVVGSPNDAWSDGTWSHPWYSYDVSHDLTSTQTSNIYSYLNEASYHTTISDYFGIALRTNWGRIRLRFDGTLFIENAQYTNKFEFYNNNVESVLAFIDRSGGTYFGLRYGNGSTTSGDYLTVGDQDRNTYLRGRDIYIYPDTGGIVGFFSGNEGNNGVGTSSPSYKLQVNGACAASSFPNTSDIRLKDIYNEWYPSIEDIANAPIFAFKWKNNEYDVDTHIGSSAQYWQLIAPELVTTAKDSLGTLSLQYDILGLASSVTVAKEVTKLQEELEETKEELKLLRALIAEIKLLLK